MGCMKMERAVRKTISWKFLNWKVQYEIGMIDVGKFKLKVTVEVGKFSIKLERITEFGKLLLKFKRSIDLNRNFLISLGILQLQRRLSNFRLSKFKFSIFSFLRPSLFKTLT